MTVEKAPGKLSEEVFDRAGQATVAREFAKVTGLKPVKRYTVIRRQGGDFYRAVTLAAHIEKAYDQALALPASAFKRVDPSYRAVFAGLNEANNIVVFENSAEQPIAEGQWSLTVMFPKDEGLQLQSELGLAAEEGGLRVGGYMFDFNVINFNLAKAKAMQVIAWLSGRGYEIRTSWGDVDLPLDTMDAETIRSLNETGECFYKEYESSSNRTDIPHAIVTLYDRNHTDGDEWARRLKRLRSRLGGAAEETSVRMSRAQVRALLDLAGEVVTDCAFFVQSIETDVQDYSHVSNEQWELFKDAIEVIDPLVKILDELRNALELASTKTDFSALTEPRA